MTANVNAEAIEASPLGGVANAGYRVVYLRAAKATQNDTVTVTNCNEVLVAQGWVDTGSSKSVETITSSTSTPKVLTLAASATGTVHLMCIVR